MFEAQTTTDGAQAALSTPAQPKPHERKLFSNALEYFGTIDVAEQIAMFQDLNFDIVSFSEAVKEHRTVALADIDTAIESIKKARRKPASKKSELLRLRFHVEVKQLHEGGLTPKEICMYLKEQHSFVVKEPTVKNYITVLVTEKMLKSSETCEEIERHADWTNQQLAHHLNGKFKLRTTAAVVKGVRAELEKEAN